jgi:hypothetical protein
VSIYDFIENAFDEERPPMPYQAMEMNMKARAMAPAEPSLNMEIEHSKTIHVTVDIWYRVSPL